MTHFFISILMPWWSQCRTLFSFQLYFHKGWRSPFHRSPTSINVTPRHGWISVWCEAFHCRGAVLTYTITLYIHFVICIYRVVHLQRLSENFYNYRDHWMRNTCRSMLLMKEVSRMIFDFNDTNYWSVAVFLYDKHILTLHICYIQS